jgi:hypothetical protein
VFSSGAHPKNPGTIQFSAGGVALVRVEHRLEERAAARVLGEVPKLGLERREHGVGERLELIREPVPFGLADSRVGEGSGFAGPALELIREAAGFGRWGALAAAEDAEELACDGGYAWIVRAVHGFRDDSVGDCFQRRLELS